MYIHTSFFIIIFIGNCRSRLKGHTSPVDFLRLSPNGSICLSMSSHLKDRSVRLWDLNKGN